MEVSLGQVTAPTERVSMPWPDTRRGTTQEIIEACRTSGLLTRNVVGYANATSWIAINSTQPPTNGAPKYWRSEQLLQPGNEDKPDLYMAIPARDMELNPIAISPVPTGFSEQDETFNFYGATVQKYLIQHSDAIGKICKLVLFRCGRPGAERLSFLPGVPTDFPAVELIYDPGGPIQVMHRANGTIWAGPSTGPNPTNQRSGNAFDGDWFLRINEAGQVEYCRCQGFAANGTDAATASYPAKSVADADLPQRVVQMAFTGGDASSRGKAIREFFGR